MRDFFMVKELTTQRLLLQQIQPEDQRFIYEGLSHPDVIPFYGVRYDSFEATKTQMEWYAKACEEDTGGPWKIVDKVSGEKLGVIAYYFHKKEHRKAEVGFWLLPQYWGKGIVSEAMQQLIQYCKNEKNIHRLEAFVEEGNKASCRVLEKANFKYEGTMKDCEIKNGSFVSLLIYALILY
jgi:ribosomal-protein-alanine N-acetyltransferase